MRCVDPSFDIVDRKDLEKVKNKTHSNSYYNDMEYGTCPECGQDTLDGQAVFSCNWSPEVCEHCGHRPCDWSC